MAVLLHFFFLSAFAWMLVEGLHLYSMVVKVFGSEGSKHFYYYGIGWGRSALQSLIIELQWKKTLWSSISPSTLPPPHTKTKLLTWLICGTLPHLLARYCK